MDECLMNGCRGRGNCSACGRVDYHLLGHYGAIGRWSKVWNLTDRQTEDRMTRHAVGRDVRRGDMSEEDAEAILADLTDPRP